MTYKGWYVIKQRNQNKPEKILPMFFMHIYLMFLHLIYLSFYLSFNYKSISLWQYIVRVNITYFSFHIYISNLCLSIYLSLYQEYHFFSFFLINLFFTNRSTAYIYTCNHRLFVKVPENVMRLTLSDLSWIVHITFFNHF